MDSFKLSKSARTAFKHKLKDTRVDNLKQKRLAPQIKQEFQNEIKIEPDGYEINQDYIKSELSCSWNMNCSGDREPKHDISSMFSDHESKIVANEIKHSLSRTIGTKNFQTKKKVQRKYDGYKRRPQFFTAVNVHKHLSAKDPNSLTSKELDSLSWSESVIMAAILRRIENESVVPIEIPGDNNNDLNEAFISNETIQVIPDTFQLAIVDFARPGGRYSLENARLIEKTLCKAVITNVLENPNADQPVFGKSVYFDGVLVLDCKDQVAYNFAKLVLCDIKLWPGSALKMVEPEKCPFASIGCLHVPDVKISKKKVMDVLKAQNPSVNMHNWKILGETTLKNGDRQYSIMMWDPPIYFQKHKQLRLYFGGSEVILKLFGCQWLWHCKV